MEISEFFEKNKKVAVAFSGGVDSSVLLALALKNAQSVAAYYVKTQFQPEFELRDAVKIADILGAELKIIDFDILSDSDVVKNPADRCYYCKKNILKCITETARADGFDIILDGTNASDDVNDRPGYKALRENGVLSPLRECGYTKEMIRSFARDFGLSVADKPSYACLATRIPTGTPITGELLSLTERNEDYLRSLGFKNFRIRYNGKAARLEMGKNEFCLLFKNREEIYKKLSDEYSDVYLDLRERADE